MKKLLYTLLITFLFACSNKDIQQTKTTLSEGTWIFNFEATENQKIPINVTLSKIDSSYQIIFSNNSEKITTKDIIINNDSIIINDPVFNVWFEGKIIDSTTIKGFWYKENKKYAIPFEANKTDNNRFLKPKKNIDSNENVTGKWEVDFSKNDLENHYKAIGLFTQSGNHLSGTFLTETGDYRYLEGNMYGDEFYLSCYDGSHLFLFKATLKNDTLTGKFWSGSHWEEPWVAFKNETFELSDPDSLTFLKEGYDKLAFSFPNLEGDTVSLNDDEYQNKVVIVNIMGPWCPNCKDEAVHLVSLYDKYHSDGLEIISLSFNKSEDFEVSKKILLKLKKHFKIEYDFLIAGKAKKDEAAKVLPMLNHIMSFPTSIFIDRKGVIRKIRTGFYGPGTGVYYTRYIEKTNSFVDKLITEK